jgi:hypothetical protein
MQDVILTPRIAMANDWTVTANCDKCRVLRQLHIETLFRKFPDRDLGEALVRGRFRCTKCEQTCTGLDVSRRHGGLIKSVMKLTPGLTVTRIDEE